MTQQSPDAIRETAKLAQRLRELVKAGELPIGRDEYELQDAIARVLDPDTLREHVLDAAAGPSGRIDFLCRTRTLPRRIQIGVEVKVASATAVVLRQLGDYLWHESIDGIVLVTTKVTHRAMPPFIHGKRVEVVWVHAV